MVRLGQHFLKDKKILAQIAREALRSPITHLPNYSITPVQIIEIGPGHGELTREIIKQLGNSVIGGNKIIAIEKDAKLYAALVNNPEFKGKVQFVHGDARKVLPSLITKLPNYPITIFGNIPYYLTGYLLRLLGNLITRLPSYSITKISLLVQKEVAARACATAPRMNLLSAMLRGWAEPTTAFTVPRSAFTPPPKVDSALLLLTPRLLKGQAHREMGAEELAHYFEVVKKVFRQPRKTLTNNLMSEFSLSREDAEKFIRTLGLKENARASELTPEHIGTLVKLTECVVQ